VNDLLERVEADLDRFEGDLLRRGFRRVSTEAKRAFEGTITLENPAIAYAIRVVVPVRWPFTPTIVIPLELDDVPSWHRMPDGALCLFSRDEDGFPWAGVDALLKQTQRWFDEERRGWAPDLVDLDLERYFERMNGLVLYHELDPLIGRFVKTHNGRNGTLEVTTSGRSAARKTSDVWVGELGKLERPVRNWEELAARLEPASANQIERWIRASKSTSLLLLRYEVGDSHSVIVLRAKVDDDRITLRSVESAAMTTQVMGLRAGRYRAALADRSVAVIGVGAVGSALAGLLARCGIGHLELHDSERLRPGNCIRHLAGQEDIGKTKVQAVSDVLRREHIDPPHGVELHPTAVLGIPELDLISSRVDLVVDCTGSSTSAALLRHYATATARPALAVYLQRGGAVVRLERYPYVSDPVDVFVVPPAAPGGALPVFEQGCGEPVSPSTPAEAALAAALACEAAIAVLGDGWPHDARTLVIDPQRDAPLDARIWLE